MNIRRTKQWLWILAALFSGGGIMALIMGLWLPYKQPAPYAAVKQTDRLSKSTSPFTAPTLEEFKGIWNLNLRPPLNDPPEVLSQAAPAEIEVVHVVRPNLKLIGYTVESDQSLAILLGPDGALEFKAVGEELSGVTVRSITAAGVMMDHEGDEYLMKFDDEPQSPSATPLQSRRVDRSKYEVGRYR